MKKFIATLSVVTMLMGGVPAYADTTQEMKITDYFTKESGDLNQVVINNINQAQSTLDIAIYTITKSDIVNAIVNAKERGVTVRVITDSYESRNVYEKNMLDILAGNNIPVKVNTHAGLMHMKVCVVDDSTVLVGSYNYTNQATINNDETLLVMAIPPVANDYETEFNNMWADTSNYTNY